MSQIVALTTTLLEPALPFMFSRHSLFYLGGAPLVVLLALWVLSMKQGYAWTRAEYRNRATSLISENSRLFIYRYRVIERRDLPGYPGSDGMTSSTGPLGTLRKHKEDYGCQPQRPTWFPKFLHVSATTDSHFFVSRTTHTLVPYWLIILAYLPPWLGIAWLQHVRKRPNRLIHPNSVSTSESRSW